MKIFFSLFFLCASICVLTSSCSKTEIKSPVTIVGFWVGTFQVTGDTSHHYVSYDLRPDSVLLYKSVGSDGNNYYGEGTYSLSGTSFSYSFTTLNMSQAGVVQNGTGTYTAGAATIIGNWQNQGIDVAGTFNVKKDQ